MDLPGRNPHCAAWSWGSTFRLSSNSPTFGNIRGTIWWRNLSNRSWGVHNNQIFKSWQGLWWRWYSTRNIEGHEQLWGLLADSCVPSSLENWWGTEAMANLWRSPRFLRLTYLYFFLFVYSFFSFWRENERVFVKRKAHVKKKFEDLLV